MGREVKRVPLDFEWPMNQPWGGYLLPESLRLPECPECHIKDGQSGYSDGYTPFSRQIKDTFYAYKVGPSLCWQDKLSQQDVDHLVEKGHLRHYQACDPATNQWGRNWEWASIHRLAADVNAANNPATRSPLSSELYLSSMEIYVLTIFRCEKLGLPMYCPRCSGEGTIATAEQQAAYDAWERSEPPAGEGWQLWETVSEGSPISPVFQTESAFVGYLVEQGHSRKAAESFVEAGSAPTMMMDERGLRSDIDVYA